MQSRASSIARTVGRRWATDAAPRPRRRGRSSSSSSAAAASARPASAAADAERFARASLETLVREEESAWARPAAAVVDPDDRRRRDALVDALAARGDDDDDAASDDLERVQTRLECEAQTESVARYEAALESARARGEHAETPAMRRRASRWYAALRDALAEEQRGCLEHPRGRKDRGRYGPYLLSLKPEKLAVISLHVATAAVLTHQGGGAHGAPMLNVAKSLGEAVEAEVHVQKLLRKRVLERRERNKEERDRLRRSDVEDEYVDHERENSQHRSQPPPPQRDIEFVDNNPEWTYGASHLAEFVQEFDRSESVNPKTRLRVAQANRRALRLLETDEEWTDVVKVKLGALLVQTLLDHVHLENGRPVFLHEKRWIDRKRLRAFVRVDDDFHREVVSEGYRSLAPLSTRHKPMVVPPTPWTDPDRGGYRLLRVDMMRTHDDVAQREVLSSPRLSMDVVYDSLNSLGAVPWRIRGDVLDTALECWNEGVVVGTDVPPRDDLPLPFDGPPTPPPRPSKELFENKDSPEFRESAERYAAYRKDARKHNRVLQHNMDLRSLRCSALLKLDQARQFRDFPEIYFPYNLDFRGRAYPVPPHLSNVGSDLSRGLLVFADKKPLGERGFHWLLVHLANLAGFDKADFDARRRFAEDRLPDVVDSARRPLDGDRWWTTAEDPFQALATCREIAAALDSGDPATYESGAPVHMDGSCNGLQHYAALGRDEVGGAAVNLTPSDAPRDVYSGVMDEVVKRVAEEARRTVDVEDGAGLTRARRVALRDNKAAKLIDGCVDRGVVKRTVMTSVYGVTFVGAQKQIKEKLSEKLAAKGVDLYESDDEVHAASAYLASVTMDVMGDLFTGARSTMDWLTSCARIAVAHGTPISWMSPVGVPIVQPYRRTKPRTVVTLVQHVVLTDHHDASGRGLPVHRRRQVSAFPPNYVHSLDASHMMLTASEMDRRGLVFSAVHDSYWTHAADVDEMNVVLRDCFVDLYERPLLEELKASLELRYPGATFPDLPRRGDLDLNEVRNAPYFFQ